MSYSPPSHPPSSAVPVTRTDTLTQIREWLEDQRNSSSILWLYSPKAGKSISAETIADLCRAGHPGLLKPINWITCLDPTLPTKSMVTQFQSLTVEAFEQYTPSPTAPTPIIILDRLDECPSQESQLEILHIIGRSAAELKLPLRYIITSRPKPHLREAFKRDPLYEITHSISIDDQYNSTSDDPSSRCDPQQEHHSSPLLQRFVHFPLERQHIHYDRPYSIRDFPQLVSVQSSNGNAEVYSRSPLLSGNGFPVRLPGGDLGKSVKYLQTSLSPGDAGLSKAMSEQPWVGGQLAASSDSESRSGHEEKESHRSLAQQSFGRQDARVRGTDEDYVAGGQGLVGSYRSEAGGGLSGHPSDSQSRSGNKEESARFSMQPSSTRPDPRGKRADTDFVVGSYRGEVGGGISGYPSDSQTRSGQKEKESARLPAQPTSSRQYPWGRGVDTDFTVGSYRGEAGGGISGHPSDSQSRWGNKGKESSRSLGQQSSSRSDPRVRETDADYGIGGQGSVGGYRGEASGGALGQPQPWTGELAPALAPSSAQRLDYTFCGSNRPLYAEQDNRASTFPAAMMGATEHSSRSPPNLTTSVPQRQEAYGAYPPTRPPQQCQHEVQYLHPSQVQRSLDSQRPENVWDGGSSRLSGGWDSSSSPSAGATGSHPWSGQPASAPPGWFAHPPHRVSFSPFLPQIF
jgi:hypothetical protein